MRTLLVAIAFLFLSSIPVDGVASEPDQRFEDPEFVSYCLSITPEASTQSGQHSLEQRCSVANMTVMYFTVMVEATSERISHAEAVAACLCTAAAQGAGPPPAAASQ